MNHKFCFQIHHKRIFPFSISMHPNFLYLTKRTLCFSLTPNLCLSFCPIHSSKFHIPFESILHILFSFSRIETNWTKQWLNVLNKAKQMTMTLWSVIIFFVWNGYVYLIWIIFETFMAQILHAIYSPWACIVYFGSAEPNGFPQKSHKKCSRNPAKEGRFSLCFMIIRSSLKALHRPPFLMND